MEPSLYFHPSAISRIFKKKVKIRQITQWIQRKKKSLCFHPIRFHEFFNLIDRQYFFGTISIKIGQLFEFQVKKVLANGHE